MRDLSKSNELLSLNTATIKKQWNLEQIIEGQKKSYQNGMEMIQMLDKELSFNYDKFVKSSLFVSSGSTFFGTKASYQASISSGRLTYFGIDSLSNEVGKVYEHH